VDYEGLNDRKTTTEGTVRLRNFRSNVVRRDGPVCVITGEGEDHCDAIHLIPHSKGNEYIDGVMRLRSPEGGLTSHIDMTENGIFLYKGVHSKHTKKEVAFLKTPNYGLRPEDIKRFRRGDERQAYITLQWIKKPKKYDPTKAEAFKAIQDAGIIVPPSFAHEALQSVDALFGGEGVPLPFTVILDYLYGVAAYAAWRSKSHDGFEQMRAYRNANYVGIPPLPPSPDGLDETDVTSGPDDPGDSEYKPAQPRKQYTTSRGDLEEAMDELNLFLMYIHGITPEMAAERRQKEIEREEQAAQEASRSKVMEWRNHLDVY